MQTETETNYLSNLPAELISKIFSFLDARDRHESLCLSKFLYNVSTSTRIDHVLHLDGSGFIWYYNPVPSFSAVREHLDIYLMAEHLQSETKLKRMLDSYRVVRLSLFVCDQSILNKIAIGECSYLFLRMVQLENTVPIVLNRLQALPTLAPNLEFLEVHDVSMELFTGAEPFLNLKTLYVGCDENKNLLEVISSFAQHMPNLTGFIFGHQNYFSQKPLNVLGTLSNLEYIELSIGSLLVPLASTNALTQLYLACYSTLQIEDPQISPLANIETLGLFGKMTNVYPAIKYYGIGANLKSIFFHLDGRDLEGNDVYGVSGTSLNILSEHPFWGNFPNLENLAAYGEKVQVKSLVSIANVCKRLRMVSFNEFQKDEGNLDLEFLPTVGIKYIYVKQRLSDKLTKFLLDSGIDIVYNSERFKFPRSWPMRRID